MNVLLDTCALAELHHPKGNRFVRNAVAALPDEALFVSAISLGEITKGVELLPDGRKKRELSRWLAALEEQFTDRIMIVDREVAGIWGKITARAQAKGLQIPALDGLIAATALRHGLHVMTRNTKHFNATGVFVLDPWKEAGG